MNTTLKAKAKTELENLPIDAAYPVRFHCEVSGQRLEAEIVALDTLGCAFNYLRVDLAALASAPVESLKRIAQLLSTRLTYLLEPITSVEIDTDQCAIQMRSNPPQKDDNGTTYYELLVKKSGLVSLCRYRKQPGEVRGYIAAHVTREVFLRLVDDFSKAAA